jgi:prephenate dehydratase
MINKIAIQGELGAYSHLAATKIFKNTKVIACKTFEDVFKQCKKNKEVISVIPIENSLAGRVADIHYLLPKYKLKIVGEYYLPVEHCLLANHGVSLKQISHVRSHSHAIGQCHKNLNKYKLTSVVAADTAGSAKYISENKNQTEAAIASSLAAKIYKLKILKKNFEDHKGNTTRFLIMRKNYTFPKIVKNKKFITTCIFMIKSTPGALFKALGGFAQNNVNLTKLESFSVNNTFLQTIFYLDIEGHAENVLVKKALQELKKQTKKLDILGIYSADSFRYKK